MKWLAISNLSVDNIHDKKGLSNIGFLIQLYVYVYIRVREIGAAWIKHNESSYRVTLKKQWVTGEKGRRARRPPLFATLWRDHCYIMYTAK
jgi:hypothetical protein